MNCPFVHKPHPSIEKNRWLKEEKAYNRDHFIL